MAKLAEVPEFKFSKTTLPVPKIVRVGSDCSGLGTDIFCYEQLKLKFESMFACEKETNIYDLYQQLHTAPKNFYSDITTRDHAAAPEVDVYTIGAPCPAWSHAGLHGGLHDKYDRGSVMFHGLNYIRLKRPRVAILEQVEGMKTQHRELFDFVVNLLKSYGYTVQWDTITPIDVGIPQSRPRIYVVAIRKDSVAHPFVFTAKRDTCTDLSSFLDCTLVGKGLHGNMTDQEKAHVTNATSAAKACGYACPGIEWIIVDASAGPNQFYWCHDKMPCVTAARAKSKGYYILKLNRFTTMMELAKLQGMDVAKFEKLKGVKTWIGTGIGNAMTLPVLKSVIGSAVWAAGLCDKNPCAKST